MKRNIKKHYGEIKLPELFHVEGEKIQLTEDIYSFFEEELMSNAKNIAVDEKGEVLIMHFVLDRTFLEDYTNHVIDDATCKIIVKGFQNEDFISNMKESYEDYAKACGHDIKVTTIDFEFNNDNFQVIVTGLK